MACRGPSCIVQEQGKVASGVTMRVGEGIPSNGEGCWGGGMAFLSVFWVCPIVAEAEKEDLPSKVKGY